MNKFLIVLFFAIICSSSLYAQSVTWKEIGDYITTDYDEIKSDIERKGFKLLISNGDKRFFGKDQLGPDKYNEYISLTIREKDNRVIYTTYTDRYVDMLLISYLIDQSSTEVGDVKMGSDYSKNFDIRLSGHNRTIIFKSNHGAESHFVSIY